MSIEEFRKASELYQRKSLLAFYPMLVAMMIFIAYLPFDQRFKNYIEERFQPPISDFLPGILYAIITISPFLSMIPLSKRIERKYGFTCRRCGKPLHYPLSRGIIIASRNCPHCGKQVIEAEA